MYSFTLGSKSVFFDLISIVFTVLHTNNIHHVLNFTEYLWKCRTYSIKFVVILSTSGIFHPVFHLVSAAFQEREGVSIYLLHCRTMQSSHNKNSVLFSFRFFMVTVNLFVVTDDQGVSGGSKDFI